MRCPYCDDEMEKGASSFMAMQGFGSMILSFVSDEEAKKGIFKRHTHDATILSASKTEAFYCGACKKIITISDEN